MACMLSAVERQSDLATFSVKPSNLCSRWAQIQFSMATSSTWWTFWGLTMLVRQLWPEWLCFVATGTGMFAMFAIVVAFKRLMAKFEHEPHCWHS